MRLTAYIGRNKIILLRCNLKLVVAMDFDLIRFPLNVKKKKLILQRFIYLFTFYSDEKLWVIFLPL